MQAHPYDISLLPPTTPYHSASTVLFPKVFLTFGMQFPSSSLPLHHIFIQKFTHRAGRLGCDLRFLSKFQVLLMPWEEFSHVASQENKVKSHIKEALMAHLAPSPFPFLLPPTMGERTVFPSQDLQPEDTTSESESGPNDTEGLSRPSTLNVSALQP